MGYALSREEVVEKTLRTSWGLKMKETIGTGDHTLLQRKLLNRQRKTSTRRYQVGKEKLGGKCGKGLDHEGKGYSLLGLSLPGT